MDTSKIKTVAGVSSHTVYTPSLEDLKAMWVDCYGSLYCETELPDGNCVRPLEWYEAGFTPKLAWQWWEIGATCLRRVKILREAGYTLEDLAKPAILNGDHSIGYLFCSGQLTLEQVKELVG